MCSGGGYSLNHKTILMILLILITVAIGASYAYWQFNNVQNDLNIAGTNCFSLTYTDNTDSLILDNIVPTEDEEGLKEKGYSFTVKNTCNTIATYEVNLEDILASSNIKHMPNKYIKVSLNDSTPKVLNTYEEVKTTISNATNSFKLTSGSLKPYEEATYELKLWMDSETPAIDEVMSATFESKITVNTSYIAEENLTNDITIVATSQNEDYSKEKETFTIDITSTNKNIIEYSFNKQTWTSVTPTKKLTIEKEYTKEGSYPIYVKDEVGNIKEYLITTDKLDQTAPERKIESINNQESYLLKITMTDTKSGMSSYQITESKETPSEWLDYTDVIEQEITQNGIYYIWSKDKLGNISYEAYSIDKIDKEAPSIELSHTLTDWGVKDTIQIHLTDDIIGLSGYQVTTIEEEPTDFITIENTLETTINYEVTENNTYYVYAKDAYNHVSHKEITIDKVDNQPPNQSFSVASSTSGSNGWYKALSIKATVSDSQSGVSSSKYCTTTASTCTPSTTASLSNNTFAVTLGTNASAQKVCVNTTDKVGNVSSTTCSSSYSVDTTNPTAKISASVSGSSIKVSASGSSDSGSGIATYYYSKDGGKNFTTSTSNSYTFTGLSNATYTLTVKVADKSGRVSSNVSTTAKVNVGTIATTLVTNLVGKGQVLADDPGGNARYIGANPNNYVSFNGELWRIIGSFKNIGNGRGTNQTRLKIIRVNSYGSDVSYGSSGLWASSTVRTTLNSTFYNAINSTSKSLISNAVWYIGTTSGYVTASKFYSYERSGSTWTGIVGLLAPSDYGYATAGNSSTSRSTCLSTALHSWTGQSNCYNNDWLHMTGNQWTMNSQNSSWVNAYGQNLYLSEPSDKKLIRPVVFLNTNVKIMTGSGTSSSPYTLGT